MATLRCMARILGNVKVKAKLLIKPLCHRYFPQVAFACSNSSTETLGQGVKHVQSFQ